MTGSGFLCDQGMRRKIWKDLKLSVKSFSVFALPLEFCLPDILTLYLSKEDTGHVHTQDVVGAHYHGRAVLFRPWSCINSIHLVLGYTIPNCGSQYMSGVKTLPPTRSVYPTSPPATPICCSACFPQENLKSRTRDSTYRKN